MNHLRIVISCLLVFGGYFFAEKFLQLAFSERLPLKFDVYGIHNIASSIACLFFGIYMVIYYLNEIKTLPFPIGEFNKVSLFLIGFGVAFGFLLNTKIDSNIERQGYFQCSELTKVATRFTKKVYAKTPQICEQLVKEKYGRD